MKTLTVMMIALSALVTLNAFAGESSDNAMQVAQQVTVTHHVGTPVQATAPATDEMNSDAQAQGYWLNGIYYCTPAYDTVCNARGFCWNVYLGCF